MSIALPESIVDPNDVELLRQIHQNWSGGNQAQAMDSLRPLANEDRPWAVALMAWLSMQLGAAGMEQSIEYAVRASRLGMPWQAVHTFNNLIGQISSVPGLADRIPELLQAGTPWWSGFDPIGQGWNLISQGHAELAMRVMSMSGSWPGAPADWESLVSQGRARLIDLERLTSSAREERDRVATHSADAITAIGKAKDDLETSAKTAGLLVTSTTSDATNALFKADAIRNRKESRLSWIAGLVVLATAALIAVLPLVLHYRGEGPDYSTTALMGAHLASTVALATFAGVLLARARSRDLAAQRANDLSTAMGTMISYSNQISDPAERERFMTTMGQLVLQAHLTSGSGHAAKDDSLSGILALANLLRPAGSTP